MSPTKSSRRDFLKVAAGVGGALAVGGVARSIYNHVRRDLQPERAQAYLESLQPGADPKSLPNIVIILCDDLGYGDIDSPALNLPNIRRLSTEGIRLSNFYASAAVCSPSRAGLLTGRYPVRTLITMPLHSTYDAMNVVLDMLGYYSYNVQGIPEDEILLPEALSRVGYRAGLVGKWHLGSTSGHIPNDRGFDSFYGALWSNDDQPYAIYRDREVEIPAPADQNQLTRNFTFEAQKFLRASKDRPFLLYLAHAMPHYPVHASEDFRMSSEAGLYGDAVQELDWSTGQVLETLEELGLSENTLVLLASDNGPWWQGNPGYLRGRKLLTFEGGFRVPFIAKWPGVIPAGATSDEMCVNLDLFATLMRLAGAPLPQDRAIDGMDILPVLRGEAPSPRDRFFYYDARKLVAVRYQQWKYHRRYRTDNAAFWPLGQGPFLFDLTTDPNESYSLVENEPELAAQLDGMLDTFDAKMEENLRGWL
ncbi:MAG: sulfatase [Chloroflexota bacterium]